MDGILGASLHEARILFNPDLHPRNPIGEFVRKGLGASSPAGTSTPASRLRSSKGKGGVLGQSRAISDRGITHQSVAREMASGGFVSKPAENPHKNLESAYAAARKAEEPYRQMMDAGAGVNKRLGGQALHIGDSKEEWQRAINTVRNNPGKVYTILPPLKGKKRAKEKVETEYEGDTTRLADLNRSSVVVPTLDGVPAAIQAVHEEAKARGWKIIKVKHRIDNPGPDGYRDVQLRVQTDSGLPTEVQIHLREIWLAKEAGQGHVLYERVRAIEARAARADRDLTPAEEKTRQRLTKEMAKLYGNTFHRHYELPKRNAG